jgi:type IV pilus assembly protein PilV
MILRPTLRRRSESAGFSLIETMVALFVLGVGLLGLAMLQATGMRFNTNSYSRTQATYLAYDMIEKMRTNVGAFVAGRYDVTDITAAGTAISTYQTCHTASCACDTSTCDDAALAKYDLGQWYAVQDRFMPGALDAANLSSQPKRATIVRNGNKATVTIYWLEQEQNAQGTSTTPTPKTQIWEADIYQ